MFAELIHLSLKTRCLFTTMLVFAIAGLSGLRGDLKLLACKLPAGQRCEAISPLALAKCIDHEF
jgi:hypothetical protein